MQSLPWLKIFLGKEASKSSFDRSSSVTESNLVGYSDLSIREDLYHCIRIISVTEAYRIYSYMNTDDKCGNRVCLEG
jgi:hypothetical protein